MSSRYVTFEKKRGRFVFQLRVPVELRNEFEGRTTIRVALGRIGAEEAALRGETLAAQWRTTFARVRARCSPPLPAAAHLPWVELALEPGLAIRAVNTWRGLQAEAFGARLAALRDAQDEDWVAAEAEVAARLRALKQASRRGQDAAAHVALSELSECFRVRFQLSAADAAEFVAAFNADAVLMAKQQLEVLAGDLPLSALQVPRENMLPLARFFGTRARDLADRWIARAAGCGQPLRRKTRLKYQRIGKQLDDILGERPVECLRATDVAQLVGGWHSEGNGRQTVDDKLQLLKTLVRPVSDDAAQVCSTFVTRRSSLAPRRLPIADANLAALREVLRSNARFPDDLPLIDLMTLTGAHLGEILQLTADDVRPLGEFFAINFRASLVLKNDWQVREIVVDLRALPELATWLSARLASGGALFPNAKADKNSNFGNAESKRINRRLRTINADRRVVAQSTRNRAARVMSRAGVDPRLRRRQLGQSDRDIHERHYDPANLLDVDDYVPAALALGQAAARASELLAPHDSGLALRQGPGSEQVFEAARIPAAYHAGLEGGDVKMCGESSDLTGGGQKRVVEGDLEEAIGPRRHESCVAPEADNPRLPELKAGSRPRLLYRLEFDVLLFEKARDHQFGKSLHAPTPCFPALARPSAVSLAHPAGQVGKTPESRFAGLLPKYRVGA